MAVAPAPPPFDPMLAALVRMAVREDMGLGLKGPAQGDLTVELSIPPEMRGVGVIVARQPGIIAGTFLLERILHEYQPGMELTILTPDATRVQAGQAVAQIAGSVRTILSAERLMLNFLGRLSGVATLTSQYVAAVSTLRPPPLICDTRKTTPGYRKLEKYAVTCGGGMNHRMGLYDGVMLKDNHLAALRETLGAQQTLAALTRHVKENLPEGVLLWLEVDTLEQLDAALPGGGRILFCSITFHRKPCARLSRCAIISTPPAGPVSKLPAGSRCKRLRLSQPPAWNASASAR